MNANECTLVKNILIKICNMEFGEIEYSFQTKFSFRWNVCFKVFQVSRSEKDIQADVRVNA